MAKRDPKKLSKKHRIFAIEYIKCWNASKAARIAGYSEKSAGVTGHRLLKDDKVQAFIQKKFKEIQMSADEVLKRLGDMGRSFDPADYLEQVELYGTNSDGEMFVSGVTAKLDLDKLKEDGLSHLIKGVKNTPSGIVLEWHDPLAALTLIGKHHKLFVEKPTDINLHVDFERNVDDWKEEINKRREKYGDEQA